MSLAALAVQVPEGLVLGLLDTLPAERTGERILLDQPGGWTLLCAWGLFGEIKIAINAQSYAPAWRYFVLNPGLAGQAACEAKG